MENKRFTLTPSANSMWTVSDKETGFSISFREGLFNETQEIHKPKQLPPIPEGMEPALWAAKAMSAIGDYMAKEHPNIAMCDIESRRMVIWMLTNEKYWITMAAACRSLLIDFEGNEGQYLTIEITDYLELSGENPAGLTENLRLSRIVRRKSGRTYRKRACQPLGVFVLARRCHGQRGVQHLARLLE